MMTHHKFLFGLPRTVPLPLDLKASDSSRLIEEVEATAESLLGLRKALGERHRNVKIGRAIRVGSQWLEHGVPGGFVNWLARVNWKDFESIEG